MDRRTKDALGAAEGRASNVASVARIERSEIRGKRRRPFPGFASLNSGYILTVIVREGGRSSNRKQIATALSLDPNSGAYWIPRLRGE